MYIDTTVIFRKYLFSMHLHVSNLLGMTVKEVINLPSSCLDKVPIYNQYGVHSMSFLSAQCFIGLLARKTLV